MAQQRLLPIADQRSATRRLRWLTLEAPDLARSIRAGQYLLVRCAEEGSYDPLLRRPLFVAASEPALGQIGLLYEPAERGLAWLARGRAGDLLDVVGPFGHPFTLGGHTRNLLLLGAGAGLAALLMLAREAAARGCTVTLLVGATHNDVLPPPFLLPGEVEYQSIIGRATDLLAAPSPPSKGAPPDAAGGKPAPDALAPITWADQICAALPDDQLPLLRAAIRAIKYRWDRGLVSVLLEGPIVCGVGACGVCTVQLRKGQRMRCSDGPVFDLRDIGYD